MPTSRGHNFRKNDVCALHATNAFGLRAIGASRRKDEGKGLEDLSVICDKTPSNIMTEAFNNPMTSQLCANQKRSGLKRRYETCLFLATMNIRAAEA
jgi:hypothetical protein